MADIAARIAENVAEIRGRVAAASRRSGRGADAVRLVAVTKSVGPAEVRALVAAGCSELGEGRPQELWSKAAALADLGVRWHLVGHLQRNKVRRTLPLATLIHSADSQRLITAIEQAAAELDRPVAVLLEVNVSGEAAKGGLAPAELESLLPALAECRQLEVRGLMCMAGLEGGMDTARRQFAALPRSAIVSAATARRTSRSTSFRWA